MSARCAAVVYHRVGPVGRFLGGFTADRCARRAVVDGLCRQHASAAVVAIHVEPPAPPTPTPPAGRAGT